MKKAIKIILYAVLALILIFILLMVLGYFLIDPNDFKDQISKAAKEKTGREIVINGNIEKSIYPVLGVEINGIEIASPDGFENKQFLEVKKLQVGVKLMPLLGGDIEAEQVILDGVKATLEKREDGKVNWEFQSPENVSETESADSKEEKAEDKKDSESKPMKLQFKGVEVKNSTVVFIDKTTGQSSEVSDISFASNLESLEKPFPIKLEATLNNFEPKVNSKIKLQTKVAISKDFKKIELNGFEISIDTKSKILPMEQAKINFSSDISLDLNALILNLKNLALDAMGIKVNGDISVSNFIFSPKVNANIAIDKFSLKKLLDDMKIELPEMQKTDALSSVGLSFSTLFENNILAVKDIKIQIDEMNMGGELAVANPSDPKIKFSFNIDKVNADNYLPPPSPDSENELTEEEIKQAEMEEKKIDLTPLRELNLNGEIKIGELVANKIKTTDVKVVVKAENGVIEVSPFSAKLYDGEVEAKSTIDVRGDVPNIKVYKKLSNFQAAPFTKDFLGKERISGLANITVNSQTKGVMPDTIIRNLSGDVDFSFADGAVSGINIAQKIRSAKALFKGGESNDDVVEKTDFSAITGTVKIKDGVFKNMDLDAKTPLLRVTGSGKVNLPKMKVDYTAVVAVVGTSKGQGGKDLEDLNRVPIPLRFRGDLLDPKIDLDLKAALSAAQKQELDQKKAEAKQKVAEKKEEVKKKGEEKVKKETDKLKDKFKGKLKKFL